MFDSAQRGGKPHEPFVTELFKRLGFFEAGFFHGFCLLPAGMGRGVQAVYKTEMGADEKLSLSFGTFGEKFFKPPAQLVEHGGHVLFEGQEPLVVHIVFYGIEIYRHEPQHLFVAQERVGHQAAEGAPVQAHGGGKALPELLGIVAAFALKVSAGSVAISDALAFGMAVALKLSSGSVAARIASPGSLMAYPSRPDTMRV